MVCLNTLSHNLHSNLETDSGFVHFLLAWQLLLISHFHTAQRIALHSCYRGCLSPCYPCSWPYCQALCHLLLEAAGALIGSLGRGMGLCESRRHLGATECPSGQGNCVRHVPKRFFSNSAVGSDRSSCLIRPTALSCVAFFLKGYRWVKMCAEPVRGLFKKQQIFPFK